MNVVRGYDTAAAYDGSFTRLDPGGYICQIIDAKVEPVNTRSGVKDKFVVAVDIKDGSPFDGYFRRQFERAKEQKGASARWGAIYETFLETPDGMCNPYFKGLIKCVEDSNTGFKWAWVETALCGKKIGIVFGEERYTGNDGMPRTVVKPFFARPVQAIADGVDIPPMRDRTQQAQNQQNYANARTSAPTVGRTNSQAMFTQVDDDELPF